VFTDSEKAATVLANRARVLMRLRRWDEAVQDLKRAGVGADSSANPRELRDVALVWELARALFLGGHLEESAQTHRQLLAGLEKVRCVPPPPFTQSCVGSHRV
jgi:hypothetical protein